MDFVHAAIGPGPGMLCYIHHMIHARELAPVHALVALALVLATANVQSYGRFMNRPFLFLSPHYFPRFLHDLPGNVGGGVKVAYKNRAIYSATITELTSHRKEREVLGSDPILTCLRLKKRFT